MFTESIIASVRIKPNLSGNQDSTVLAVSEKVIEFSKTKERFEFEHIFPQSEDNNGIYEKLVKPLVESSLQGFNGFVFY